MSGCLKKAICPGLKIPGNKKPDGQASGFLNYSQLDEERSFMNNLSAKKGFINMS
jgi:hypothetical protein